MGVLFVLLNSFRNLEKKKVIFFLNSSYNLKLSHLIDHIFSRKLFGARKI